jgi:hypothetical protein
MKQSWQLIQSARSAAWQSQRMKQSWQLIQSARAAAWQSQNRSQLVGLQNRWRE